eukprot:1275610-Alexandrium_andersonii.AAC.1
MISIKVITTVITSITCTCIIGHRLPSESMLADVRRQRSSLSEAGGSGAAESTRSANVVRK